MYKQRISIFKEKIRSPDFINIAKHGKVATQAIHQHHSMTEHKFNKHN